jgi:hypothetical protein
MWLFTRYGFYSISVYDGKFTVRARLRKHLTVLQHRFPVLSKYQVEVMPERDYRYRLYVDRDVWENVVCELTREQTWGNFKSEVARFGGRDEYERTLHEVWEVMHRLQWEEEHGKEKTRNNPPLERRS